LTKKDGLNPRCNKCKQKYREANREHINRLNKVHYKLNRESRIAYNKKYNLLNKNEIATQRKEYYNNNKKELAIKNKQYREANKELLAEKEKNYRKSNKEKIAARGKRYRQTEKGRMVYINTSQKRRLKLRAGDATTEQLLELHQNAKRCYWCNCNLKKVKVHIDHYIPLAKGGEHTLSNLVVSCSSCNLAKKDKSPIEFAQNLGKLL